MDAVQSSATDPAPDRVIVHPMRNELKTRHIPMLTRGEPGDLHVPVQGLPDISLHSA
jgi:hypothetical protein